MVALTGLLLITSCARFRYDYQRIEAQSPPEGLVEAAVIPIGDRYKVPPENEFTHQAPFTPNLRDNLIIPRPTPMHNHKIEETSNLLQHSISDQAFAELRPDGRSQASLRVNVPGELAGRSIVRLLQAQEASFDNSKARLDARVRTDCAFAYVVTKPVAITICVYTTMRSSYVVTMPGNDKDQQALDFGNELLHALLREYG